MAATKDSSKRGWFSSLVSGFFKFFSFSWWGSSKVAPTTAAGVVAPVQPGADEAQASAQAAAQPAVGVVAPVQSKEDKVLAAGESVDLEDILDSVPDPSGPVEKALETEFNELQDRFSTAYTLYEAQKLESRDHDSLVDAAGAFMRERVLPLDPSSPYRAHVLEVLQNGLRTLSPLSEARTPVPNAGPPLGARPEVAARRSPEQQDRALLSLTDQLGRVATDIDRQLKSGNVSSDYVGKVGDRLDTLLEVVRPLPTFDADKFGSAVRSDREQGAPSQTPRVE